MPQPIIFSHWSTLIENFSHSPKDFYAHVQQAIQQRQVPGISLSRISAREGGPLSASREYLRVSRQEHIFDICGAPFGTGFFVSWWLGEKPASSCLTWLLILGTCGFGLLLLPLLHRRRLTYYRLDTAQMFQSTVHSAVLEVIDNITKAKGLRVLSEADRKPIMREFYGR